MLPYHVGIHVDLQIRKSHKLAFRFFKFVSEYLRVRRRLPGRAGNVSVRAEGVLMG